MNDVAPNQQNLIIYNTLDGKVSVTMMARDGNVWMNQKQMAELFATSKQNVGQHIANILKENELSLDSVVKNFFITAADGKLYDVTFYSMRWQFTNSLTNAVSKPMHNLPTRWMTRN